MSNYSKDIGQHSKRIAYNTLVLFARMLIITFINLYTVRWVLAGLGTVDYGIFNAVAGVVMASTCLSSVLALSTQRFYSYAMGRGETKRLKEIFSVSLNIVMLMSVVLLVIFEVMGPWLVSTQLTIPAARLEAAQWILQFSLFSFLFTLLQIPFIGAVFANEDMRYYALISTIDCLVKLGIALGIGKTGGDNLVYYGVALMIETFMVMLLYIIIAKHKYQECTYVMVRDKSLYRELFSFSGWSFYGALAGVGMTQGNTILLNVFFGPVINAAFGIANQVYNAINSLTNSIIIAFRPAMIKAYSAQEGCYLEQLFFASSKAILYLLVLVMVPFIFEAKTLLVLWLGDRCTPTMVLFAQLYAVYTVCLALHNPITTLIQATGRIKKYSMYVESMTILCLPVSWVLFKMGLPAYYVFVTMIGLCVLAHIVRLFMLRSNIPAFTIAKYLRQLVMPGCLIIGLDALAIYIIHEMDINLYLEMILAFIISASVTIGLLYGIGINQQERVAVKELAKRKLKK